MLEVTRQTLGDAGPARPSLSALAVVLLARGSARLADWLVILAGEDAMSRRRRRRASSRVRQTAG
jgi:hypothetical protein